ncbi:Membrane protein [Sulfitobacter noctilucae]|nr:Membrane protein [Sulfitobacter noctilucae]
MRVDFTGRRGALFWLALKTGFFTILTLGFYRFWMKTRLRRWYWSAMRPGGHPMEYAGDPIEKLLGFFIAVVILTFYIGLVNLLLMFVSFSVFNSSVIGYLASFAGVIPLWFYARYRARRYVLARTRWRGVRFGLEKGAWGYAWRALWYWFCTIVTLGILWPRMTFLLEKYKTDRMFFGSARLYQGGRWPMLYRATLPFVFSLIALGASIAWVFYIDPVFDGDAITATQLIKELDDAMNGSWSSFDLLGPERLLLIPITLSGLLFGAIYYRWVSKRIMANHKLGPGVQFASALSGVRVTFIYVLGNFIAYLTLVLGLVSLVLLALVVFVGGDMVLADDIWGRNYLADLPRWISVVVFAVLYLTFFLLWGVLYNTFVTFPLMRHMARTTTLPVTEGLGLISQRDRDDFAEAEGFAEALDLGAAI